MSKDTQLILMTPGILLKKLAGDPMLKEYTHVLIDEVRYEVATASTSSSPTWYHGVQI